MKTQLPWVLVTISGLALRLVLAFQPVETLVSRIVPDDAFYYFVIARNAADGLGLTFDGLQATNGFHPLWAAVILPIMKGFSGSLLPVTLILCLGAVLDTLAGWIFSRLAEKTMPGAGLITLSLYLLNPQLVFGSVNGLESALALLSTAAFLWFAWRFVEKPGVRRAVLLGVFLALGFLARTDLVVLFAPVIATCAWLVYRRVESGVSNRKLITHMGVAGLTSLVTIIPWLIWNQVNTGHLVQSSAVAVPGLISEVIERGGAWSSLQLPVINFSLRSIVSIPGLSWLALLGGTILILLRRSRTLPQREDIKPNLDGIILAGSAVIGALLIVLVHTFIRWYPRDWYYLPLAAVVSLLGGVIFQQGSQTMARRAWIAAFGVFAMIFVLYSIRAIQSHQYPGQIDLYKAARWINLTLPEDQVVGGFNSGIMSWFSQRTVINLDGVVDWQAIEARKDKRLLDYLQYQRGGQYLADAQAYIEQTFSPYLGVPLEMMDVVATFGDQDSPYGPVVIYRLPAR